MTEEQFWNKQPAKTMWPSNIEYDENGGIIWANHKNGDKHRFIDIRGWGHLTGLHKMSAEQARSVQDVWGKLICDLYNAHVRTKAADTVQPAEVMTAEDFAEQMDRCMYWDDEKQEWLFNQLKASTLISRRDAARDALNASPVPAGYVLLPIEPTIKMLADFHDEAWPQLSSANREKPMREAYRAMITAAPQPPAAQTNKFTTLDDGSVHFTEGK